MSAYYNENDKNAAQWLRNLIAAGLIAPGDVDDRSVEDVRPSDLLGYTQCHFFAGIGVWSYALRRAGWSDERPIWTGSCPCQPFSAAGKRGGTADERHLWPAWFHLISFAKPRGVPVLGEQVASKDGLAWLDLVQADLEGQGYAVRSADLCAAGVGAPHIRQRLYFVADASGARAGRDAGAARRTEEEGYSARRADGSGDHAPIADGAACELADNAEQGRSAQPQRNAGENRRPAAESGRLCDFGRVVGDADDARSQRRSMSRTVGGGDHSSERAARTPSVAGGLENAECSEGARLGQYGGARIRFEEAAGLAGPGGTRGWWRDADWIFCTDQKYRPVEPGTFPLAHGVAARVGRLRAYGNAIVAPLAEEFIRAYLEVTALERLQ